MSHKNAFFVFSLLMFSFALQTQCAKQKNKKKIERKKDAQNASTAKHKHLAKGIVLRLSSLKSRTTDDRASFVNACKTVLTLCVTKELSVTGIFNLNGTFFLDGVDVTSRLNPLYGYFYLISPPDSVVVNGGDPIPFANDGPFYGISRVPLSSTDFVLPNIGVYEVSWVLAIDEAAQIDVWLDGIEQSNTISGRPAGTTQVAGCVLVEITAINTVLTLRNASGNGSITVTDGTTFGSQPLIGTLVIKQIA